MANEEFYVTVLALVLLAVIVYVVVTARCKSKFTASDKQVIITITTKLPHKGINDLVRVFTKNYPVDTKPIYYITDKGDFLPVVIEAKTSDTVLTEGSGSVIITYSSKPGEIASDVSSGLWLEQGKPFRDKRGRIVVPPPLTDRFPALFNYLGITVFDKLPAPSTLPPSLLPLTNTQNVISLTTQKASAGINDLIKEFKKTSTYYMNSSGQYIPVHVEAKVDTSLDNKTVVVTNSLDPTKPQTFTDLLTKNSIWNPNRKASVRVLDFVKLLKLRTLSKPFKFTPGKDLSKTEHNYYLITNTENESVLILVDVLNTIVNKYQYKTETNKANVGKQSLPLKFYAGTLASVSPNTVFMYVNSTLTSTRSISLTDTMFSTNPPDIVRFDKITSLLPRYDTLFNCPYSVLPGTQYPLKIGTCANSRYKEHCFLLRTTVNGREPFKCMMAPGRLNHLVNALNSFGYKDRNSTPIQFNGVVLAGDTNDDRVSSDFDYSVLNSTIDKLIIQNNITDRQNDMINLKNSITPYFIGR